MSKDASKILYTSARGEDLFWMNKIRRAERFFQRDDLIRQIEAALLPGQSSNSQSKTCVIYGAHGIGKTELAIEFAYQRNVDYDAVFFLSATTNKTLRRDYCLMGEVLGFSTADKNLQSQFQNQEDMVMAWLKCPIIRRDGQEERNANWLMILDNLDDTDIDPCLIPSNGGAHGSLLITTIRPMPLLRELGSSTGLEVPFLRSAEAAAFLEYVTMFYKNISEFDAEEKLYAERLVQRLGGEENVPFVLGVVAGLLITSTKRKEDLKYFTQNRLSDPNKGLGALFDQRITHLLADRCEYTELASAWAMVRKRVRDMSDGPNDPDHRSERLLIIFALLDRTSIPASLFTPPEASSSTLKSRPKTSLVPSDADWYQTLRDLESLSLVVRTEDRGLRLHRITVDGICASLLESSTTKEIEEAFAEAVTLLVLAWPHALSKAGTGQGHEHSRWITCVVLFPHITALKSSYFFFQKQIQDHAKILELVKLLSETAW